jgi:hypothetical protein
MPLNDPNAPGAVLRPRLRVLVNGVSPHTAIEASVTETGHFHAARFSATFVLMPSGVGSAAWWAAQTPAGQGGAPPAPLDIDVQMAFLAPGAPEGSVQSWQSLVQGAADKAAIELADNKLRIDGRDYTARLIDAKTQAAYQNQTSSEIVTILAQQVGLTAKVQKTTAPVHRYYEIEHDAVALNQFHRVTTLWDFIVTLARFEGFDTWVDGKVLHFQPPVAASADPYVVRWQLTRNGNPISNAISLSLDRNYTISKGVQVTVKSWNSKTGKGFSRSFSGNHPQSVGAKDAQNYIVVRPNLTQDQALQLAQSMYHDIVAHERIITAELVPDLILNPRVLVRLDGTGTDYDQVYYPQEVTRQISADGCSMRLSAKNQDLAASGTTGL